MLTIGSDPEFLLYDKLNHIIPAYNLFGGRNLHDEIGTDGASTTGELRPKPGKDPIEHGYNIMFLIQKIYTKYCLGIRHSDMLCRAGNMGGFDNGRPLGGHIHFDVEPTSRILDVLDTVVGVTEIAVSNNSLANTRRHHRGYGYAGGYETKYYGFEYRTPGSWLLDRGLTFGFLSIAYIAVHDYKRIYSELVNIDINPRPVINDTDKVAAIFMWKNFTYNTIRKSPLYRKYKPYIDYINHMVVQRKTWNEIDDIFARWRFRNTSITLNRDDFMHDIAQRYFNYELYLPVRHTFFYGVSEERGNYIFVNERYADKLPKRIGNYEIKVGEYGRAEQYPPYYLKVGLPYRLRENYENEKETFKSLLNAIMQLWR